MRSAVHTILFIITLIICFSLIVGGIGVCFTALDVIVKYVLFVLSVGTGITVGTLVTVFALAD